MSDQKKTINDLIWEIRFDITYAWYAFYNALKGSDVGTFENEAYEWLLKANESLDKLAKLNDYKELKERDESCTD